MHGRIITELVEKSWAELTSEEREAFDEWLKTARGEDLYMLLRHGRRMWLRGRPSSATFEAVRATAKPDEGDEP